MKNIKIYLKNFFAQIILMSLIYQYVFFVQLTDVIALVHDQVGGRDKSF